MQFIIFQLHINKAVLKEEEGSMADGVKSC